MKLLTYVQPYCSDGEIQEWKEWLMENPDVELCFWTYVYGIWKREDAPVEIIKDSEVIKILKNVDYIEITDGEHYAFDRFWDMVSTKKTMIADSFEEGFQQGFKEGREKGRKIKMARAMLAEGMPLDKIIQCTGLSEDQIQELNK